ncbi:hypothetical protein P22_0664 [Propionispora sp. 2/2-37]|uniref:MFS transporter n=1 Tax=Propionispora sp. 2/2-37 TaxID=1677858 RepID=UPI0006BB8341|nr:MFS transporter [Propionispora sp. 2/2-37]CUH94598.1 hypothetical protein P22_0664 [Propionispora sp. 2/2-37]
MSEVMVRKIPKGRWFHILPPAIIINLIAYMDRMNVSFAMAGGMNEALGLSMTISGLAAGIFFFGYLVLQIPAGHIAERGMAKKYILCTIIAWGGISLLTGFVQNSWQLLVMRFLLGVAEGGVYPSILIIIANWFPSKELGRANAMFMLSLPIAAILTNVVSGWIVSNFDWRWLFYIEGMISLALIFIWMPLISEHPKDAKWISAEEREYLITTLQQEKAERENRFKKQMGTESFSYKQMLFNKNLWLMTGIYLCHNTGQYGYSIWLPTLVKKLTQTNLTAVGFLISPPFIIALIGLYLFGVLSDRRGNRRMYTAVSFCGFGCCLLLAVLSADNIWLSYSFLVVTGFFNKSMNSPFWSMAPSLFPPGIAGGARGFINSFGNLGGFVGPTLVGWLTAFSGNMMIGLYGLIGMLLLGALLTMLLPPVTAGFTKKEADEQKSSDFCSVNSVKAR